MGFGGSAVECLRGVRRGLGVAGWVWAVVCVIVARVVCAGVAFGLGLFCAIRLCVGSVLVGVWVPMVWAWVRVLLCVRVTGSLGSWGRSPRVWRARVVAACPAPGWIPALSGVWRGLGGRSYLIYLIVTVSVLLMSQDILM